MNTRSDVDDSQTAIDYSNMQVRYYGDDYASINAMVSVTTTVRGERRTSHIGQCASLRRIEGQWRIRRSTIPAQAFSTRGRRARRSRWR